MNELSERLKVKFGTQPVWIMVVDNEQDASETICRGLQAEGFEVITADNGIEALRTVKETGAPNLVILDPALADTDGGRFIAELKRQGDIPIIFVSSVTDTEAIVVALNSDAEDYLTKPLNPEELAARVKRVLLRTGPSMSSDPEQAIDDYLSVNFPQQYALVNGQPVPLTPTENRIIQALYKHRGRVLSPGFLLVHAWDSPNRGTLESLWVHIRRLRSKIEPDPNHPTYVMTVRGRGYCLPRSDQRGKQAANGFVAAEMTHA